MDLDGLLRTARRHLGLSQRAFAERLGIPAGTLAAWEARRRTPSVAVLIRVLARAGLELALASAAAPEDAALVAHLRRPLTARLRLALGESPNLHLHPASARWQALARAALTGIVVLEEPVATAIWVPAPPQRGPIPLTVHQPRRELPELEGLRLTPTDEPPPPQRIPITVRWAEEVWVLPPAELLLQQQHALRQAAKLLEQRAPVDDAGRRRPAHRDPDARSEQERAMWSRMPARAEVLGGRFSRAWRLDAPASAAQQLRGA